MNQNSRQPVTAEGAGRLKLAVDERANNPKLYTTMYDQIIAYMVVGESGFTHGEALIHAHRLKAAWNAAAGIPTEALEQGVVADLLAACEAALPHIPGVAKHVRDMLIAAIAKAEGRTHQ